MFKNSWRNRQSTRLGGDPGDTFSAGFGEEDITQRRFSKNLEIGGLFGSSDVKGKGDTQVLATTGLFDDSDDEKEVKKPEPPKTGMMGMPIAAPSKKLGMFDIEEEEEPESTFV